MIAAGVEEKKARMRASQLWRWIYHYGVTDFAKMTDVAKELRAVLGEQFVLERPAISGGADVGRRHAQMAGRLWRQNSRGRVRLHPRCRQGGRAVRVLQVGCTLTCTFCHTGTQKLVRNLTAAEIVNQVMVARDALERMADGSKPLNLGDRLLTNIVFMGMGEPLYNLDNVVEAIETIRRRRRHLDLEAPHHGLDRRRRAEDSASWASAPARCWRSRCTRRMTTCATSSCRSTRSTI